MTSQLNSTFPWFPFAPREWIDGTRHLSLEQRGAYIDMICLQMMQEGPIREDYAWLAHQLHVHQRVAKRLVGSLIEEMKFRRTGSGMLSNERCEMELNRREEVSSRSRQSAIKRWEVARAIREQTPVCSPSERGELAVSSANEYPKDEKIVNEINGDRVTGQISGIDPAYAKPMLYTYTESIVETQSNPTNSEYAEPLRASDESALPLEDKSQGYTPSFESWWREYPQRNGKKVGKKEAFREWRKLNADQRQSAIDGLMRYLAYLEANTRERQFVPDANRWLKRAAWDTEYQSGETSAATQWWQKADLLASVSHDDWRRLINKHTHNLTEPTWSVRLLGPAPGRADCVVPDAVVSAMRLTAIYDERGLRREH